MVNESDKITQQDLQELAQKPDVAMGGEQSNELQALDNTLQTLLPLSSGLSPEDLGVIKEEYRDPEKREELDEINSNASYASSKVMALSDGIGEPIPKIAVEAPLEELYQIVDPDTKNGAWIAERIERLAESLGLDLDGVPSHSASVEKAEEPEHSTALQEVIDTIKNAREEGSSPEDQLGDDSPTPTKGNRGR